MRISLFVWLFLILLSIFCGCGSSISAYSQCVDRERSLLLQLKKSLKFSSSNSPKLGSWNEGTDCCKWGGVMCNQEGHVIDLDLNDESISGGIDNSSSLFSLHYLQRLNLAHNDLDGSQIPSGFGKLSNLIYLNMTLSSFGGQIPIEISRMTRLVTLDLSYNYRLVVKNPSLKLLFRNLTELKQLYLDGINISAHRHEWSQALSSLSNLQELGLSFCSLSGPIDSSFVNLRSLSLIRLNYNNISARVPEFFADYSNLTELHLFSCGFYGKVPERIFQIPTLLVLDLGSNKLEGFFPDSVLKLTHIVYLDLSGNNFTGPIPSLRTIPWSHFDGLVNLTSIDLSENSVGGTIPSSLIGISSLSEILLQQNQFEGQLPEFPNASSSLLQLLDLSNNKLEGLIPMSILELGSLRGLTLSFNNFSGTMQFEIFQRLGNLIMLDLAYNSLSIDASGSNSSFPRLTGLSLASCKLQQFPNLKNQSDMDYLDLSNNQISGEIPNWIWELAGNGYSYLNLSHNLLVDLQKPYSFGNATLDLDLHSNQLHGQIPIPPLSNYLDYSSNNFNYSIPVDIGFGCIIGSLLFCERWRWWYYKHVDRILLRILPGRQKQEKNVSMLQSLDHQLPEEYLEKLKRLRLIN
ncbi:hypothetical protein F0562_034455 [Nyssa sinensis]|uniref:Leucine-rich repeat-containing N-terminal plant-type domain-containing protein n=1 Tax=Nyssa sinensis TaxID=561372 RepID=A0A5J5ALI3_9ASTE|nr:hypothetical protein F0562_034455 [Nyssa sinensis]